MAHGGALQRRGLQRNPRALAHQPCRGAAMDRNSLYQHPGELREWKPFLPLGLKRHCKIDYTPKGPQNTDKIKIWAGKEEEPEKAPLCTFLGTASECSRRFLPCFNKSLASWKGKKSKGSCCLHHSPHRLGPVTGLLAHGGRLLVKARTAPLREQALPHPHPEQFSRTQLLFALSPVSPSLFFSSAPGHARVGTDTHTHTPQSLQADFSQTRSTSPLALQRPPPPLGTPFTSGPLRRDKKGSTVPRVKAGRALLSWPAGARRPKGRRERGAESGAGRGGCWREGGG